MNKLTVIFCIIVAIIVINVNYGYCAEDTYQYYRGRVLAVEGMPQEQESMLLEQEIYVLLTSGPFKGDTVFLNNVYLERSPLTFYLEEGMNIIVMAHISEGQIDSIYVQDIARDIGIFYLAFIFMALLLLIGGKQGFKTILTLALTALIVSKVMLPLILSGYNPIPVAAVSAIGIIFSILLIIGGFNSKSFAAIIGTCSGVALAGILALWAGEMSHLTGFSSEEAEMLFYSGKSLDVRGLLFAGIIIGSLGAITDVGMSVASAAAEIRKANPNMNFLQLTLASINVGRDIMGTMANTLILAYVGSSAPLLLLLMIYDINWLKIINLDIIATEMVRGLVGSIGLVFSIPLTATVAGFLMGKKERNK